MRSADGRRPARWRGAPAALALVAALVASSEGVEDFLARHWQRPLAAQGAAPARYTAVEASLHPDACGTCHPAQLADWRTSFHARAMGPGVTGQLVEMLDSDPASALACFNCHAPLAEQAPLVRGSGRLDRNAAYDATLTAAGVACAACHVRAHERFGPPRRDGSTASRTPRETLPHGGVTRTPAFLGSEFCASCHQFTADGFALNGKLLENTVSEWRASRFARDGVQCQDCHMPDRRHTWRGIHDPDMVRAGITVTVDTGAAPRRARDTVVATLTVVNTGVGHAFPTYVTPRVVLRAEQLAAAGRPIPGTRREKAIERRIALDLSREHSDTRLLPGQRAVLEYRGRVAASATRARLSVVVFPDAFYTRFFETLLREGAGRGTPQVRQALTDSRNSAFTVFERDIPLPASRKNGAR
jgi:hypothetical protein